MASKIGVAVVGAGPAGQAHAFGLRNAAMSESLQATEIDLVAIVDADIDRARAIAERYGYQSAFADVSDILADARITAVSVAVPNFLAADIITRLLAAGKAVLAEKPLGISTQQARDLASLAAEAGVVTGVGFTYRRIPSLAAARQVVANGTIGKPLFASGWFLADYALDPSVPMSWRFSKETSGGGALLDMGTHAIDALEFLLGDVAEVPSAQLSTFITERPTADGSGTGTVDNDDTVMATLKHRDGVSSSLLVSRIAVGKPCEMGVSVYGTKGYVMFDFSRIGEIELYEAGVSPAGLDGPRRVISGPAFPIFADVMPMSFRGNTVGYGEAFVAQAGAFLTCVRDGARMDTSFEAAAQTMAVAHAIEESSRTQGPVAVSGSSTDGESS